MRNTYQSAAGLLRHGDADIPAPVGEGHLVAGLKAVAVEHELGIQHGGEPVGEGQGHGAAGGDGADGAAAALARRVVGYMWSQLGDYHISANLAGMRVYIARRDPARRSFVQIIVPQHAAQSVTRSTSPSRTTALSPMRCQSPG